VPEPDTLLLFGAGLLTLPLFARRRLRAIGNRKVRLTLD